jgi:hypothetical protein
MAPTKDQSTCGKHAACLGLAALAMTVASLLASGCSASAGPRRRYLAARSIVVEPQPSDAASTFSGHHPVPLQPTVASDDDDPLSPSGYAARGLKHQTNGVAARRRCDLLARDDARRTR